MPLSPSLPSRLVFVVFLGLAGAVSAQQAPAAEEGDAEQTESPTPQHITFDEAEARALFEAGLLAFQNSRFEDALERFNRAFELSGREELLFNVGIAADRLRRDDIAIDAFERFLESDPPADYRRQAEARLEFLRREVAEAETETETEAPVEADPEPVPIQPEEPSESASSEPVPIPPEAPDDEAGAGPWVLGGVGLGMTVLGGGLLGGALAASNAVTGVSDGDSWDEVSGRADRGPVLQGLGWAALGVGVAGIVGAVLWLALGTPDEDSNVALTADGLRVQWGSL